MQFNCPTGKTMDNPSVLLVHLVVYLCSLSSIKTTFLLKNSTKAACVKNVKTCRLSHATRTLDDASKQPWPPFPLRKRRMVESL